MPSRASPLAGRESRASKAGHGCACLLSVWLSQPVEPRESEARAGRLTTHILSKLIPPGRRAIERAVHGFECWRLASIDGDGAQSASRRRVLAQRRGQVAIFALEAGREMRGIVIAGIDDNLGHREIDIQHQ